MAFESANFQFVPEGISDCNVVGILEGLGARNTSEDGFVQLTP